MNQSSTRNIIIHIHFYKNAGSTIDYILSNNFSSKHGFLEGKYPWSILPFEKIIEFLANNSHIQALSSHQAHYPFPKCRGLNISPIFFLRHPIDRVGSIYSFDQKQNINMPAINLAKHGDIRSYLSFRLSDEGGITMKNFHVIRLSDAPLRVDDQRKARATLEDLEQAKNNIRKSGFFGIVEKFNESISLLEKFLEESFPQMDFSYEKQNVSPDREESMEARISFLKEEIGQDIFQCLMKNNELDLELYEYAVNLFNDRTKVLG